MNRRDFIKNTAMAGSVWYVGDGFTSQFSLLSPEIIYVYAGEDNILRGSFVSSKPAANPYIVAVSLVSNEEGGAAYHVTYNDCSTQLRTKFTDDEIKRVFKDKQRYISRFEIQPDQRRFKDGDKVRWSTRIL